MSAIQILEANYKKLPEKDQAFALSLISSSKTRLLSDKQAMWVEKLNNQINNPPKKVAPIDATSIKELFATASAKLKWPKFTINVDNNTMQFSIAGQKSKVPGAVNVTDGGKFGSNKYYGRILPDGTWQSYDATDEIIKNIRAFAADPAKMAATHGKKTGSCCFCNKDLTDTISVTVGYGKVCAENWGLPYTMKASRTTTARR
jgi:hypothetical protein